MKSNSKFYTKLPLFVVWVFIFSSSQKLMAQEDEVIIKEIYETAYENPKGYQWLHKLCKEIGGRLSGSPEAQKAVEYTQAIMDSLNLDRVYLQDVMVPHWVRGESERGYIYNLLGWVVDTTEVSICAIGNSVGTGKEGIEAQVIEVQSFEELASYGREAIEGKIVFFNQAMDSTIESFAAYGKAGFQRVRGASEAAKYGAVGVIVRSLSTRIDDYPHTGTLRYTFNLPKLPAIAISTEDAELLSRLRAENPNLYFHMITNCEMLSDELSYNVIGEIKGSTYPNQIITVGGHLDSWDLGEGAHDDGTGVIQTLEVARIFKELGIQPKRTIRFVMFMNEENGLEGGRVYAQVAQQNGEYHIAALESDSGGFKPLGFSVDNERGKLPLIARWYPYFEPYGLEFIKEGYGGADISPLKTQGTTVIGFRPESKDYFLYHHASTDTFDKVVQEDLQGGAAAMTALVYLLSEYGL